MYNIFMRNISFKYKFILSFVILEIIFLTIIAFVNFTNINKNHQHFVDYKTSSIESFTQQLLATPIAIYDIATIDNIASELVKLDGIVSIQVWDYNGKLISDIGSTKNTKKNLIQLKNSIVIDNMPIGKFSIWIDTNNDKQIIEKNKQQTLFIILLEIIISTILSWFIGHKIAQNLKTLTNSAKTLSDDLDTPIEVIFGEKEIEILSKTLESMRKQILTKRYKLHRYKQIIDQNVLISRTNLSGKITEVSKAFCDISGYSEKELLGKNHNIVRHPDMPKTIYEDMWKTIKKEKVWQGEIKNKTKDGGIYWVNTTVSPEYNEKGILIGYFSTRFDITIKKELEFKQKQMDEQSKLASMGEMIGNIAHQWRQPLNMISTKATGALFQKEMGILDDTKFEEAMESINDNAQYLSQTIDTFKNFIKSTQEKNIIETTLQNEIKMTMTLVKATYENNYISIDLDLYNKPLNCFIPEGELTQVLMNILNNAKDILKENRIEDNRWVKIKLIHEENKGIITIEDSAGGIPEDVLPKIFEPYFTTKHQSQGTGLGLHMSYKIVTESLGGLIYARNSENGAIFSIEIPLGNKK